MDCSHKTLYSILQILESKRAVMEGLVPENINGLNK